MKKTFFSLVFAALVAATLTTNAQSYQKGDKLLNLGVGLGAYTYGGLPLGGTFEYGFTDQISGGVGAEFWKAGGSLYSDLSIISISARGSYHLGEILKLNNDKLDPYAGAGLNYWKYNWGGLSGDLYRSSWIRLGIHAGARYYFKEKLGVFAEVGYSTSWLKAGVALKF